MTENLEESVIVRISRMARRKLKVLAAVNNKTQEEYLEGLIDNEETKRLLNK